MATLLKIHKKIATVGAEGPLEWLLFLLLIPFGTIYGCLGWLRGCCYDLGWLRSYQATVPVVSVGNLSAGGIGKTPVVDWLVKEFIHQEKKTAIVSRGYGGSFRGDVGVVYDGEKLLLSATEAGDEPVLLARRNRTALVLIARKRAAGIKQAVTEFGADIVILDDGFQHRAVKRDLDLVLLDARHPFGNSWPLPAGLLREFPTALKRADLVLLTRADGQSAFNNKRQPVYQSRHQLSSEIVSLAGDRCQIADLKSLKVFAFAGIASPDSFFSALQAAGLQLAGTLSLGDHCCYDRSILAEILAASAGCDALLTTEKDAVKLSADMFSAPCYQVPMDIRRPVDFIFLVSDDVHQ